MSPSDKTIGLMEIYLKGYPHKRNYPFKPSTVPIPYIKKEDVSLHQYAADFHLFRDVVNDYLDYITENLIEGNLWSLNFGLGEVRIKKFQLTFLRDNIAKKGTAGTDVKTIYKRIATPDDYFLAPRWQRKSIHVKLKYNWILHLARPIIRECYNRVKKDFTHIYKYQDS